jgi:hypothetical protein
MVPGGRIAAVALATDLTPVQPHRPPQNSVKLQCRFLHSLVRFRTGKDWLAGSEAHPHPAVMFMVTEKAAAAIRAVYERDGELSAAIELRRLFPGIIDNARARDCARAIAGWMSLPVPPAKVTPLRPRKDR